jgi:hypothetical protein
MSGSFMNHVYHLRSLELITGGNGTYTASEELF